MAAVNVVRDASSNLLSAGRCGGEIEEETVDLKATGEGSIETNRTIGREGVLFGSRRNDELIHTLSASCLFMTIGPTLILLNKAIYTDFRFPFPIFVSFLGIFASAVTAYVSIGAGAASYYSTGSETTAVPPCDQQRPQQQRQHAPYYAYQVLPIAACLAASLAFGNTPYLYLGVSFIQICKTFAPIVVLVTLRMLGIERYTPPAVALSLGLVALGDIIATMAVEEATISSPPRSLREEGSDHRHELGKAKHGLRRETDTTPPSSAAAVGRTHSSTRDFAFGLSCLVLSMVAESLRIALTQYLLRDRKSQNGADVNHDLSDRRGGSERRRENISIRDDESGDTSSGSSDDNERDRSDGGKRGGGMGVLEGMYIVSPPAALALLLCSAVVEGGAIVRAQAWWRILERPLPFVSSMALGVIINFSSYMVIQTAGGVALKLLSTVRNLGVVIVGVAFFREGMTRREFAGYGLSLIGSGFYLFASQRHKVDHLQSPKDRSATRREGGGMAETAETEEATDAKALLEKAESMVIAQVAVYSATSIVYGVVLVLILVFISVIPAVASTGMFWKGGDVKFIPHLSVKASKLKRAGATNEAIADILDTPFDVLREQNKLAKLLDNDSWRQKAMRSSVTASFSNSDGPGLEIPSMQKNERTENDNGEGNEQQITVEDLDSLLTALGLEHLLFKMATAQFGFEALHSLAQHDAVCCTNELKEAGVTVPGHRVKIVVALLNT